MDDWGLLIVVAVMIAIAGFFLVMLVLGFRTLFKFFRGEI